MIEDRGDWMRATGMPGCMPQSEHEDVAAEPKSATGQYLKPLLERASVRPELVEGRKAQPSKKARSSRAKSRGADEDQPSLIAAK